MQDVESRIGKDGFPLISLHVRKQLAHAGDPYYPLWAIVDSAAARSYIDPDILKQMGFPKSGGRSFSRLPLANGVSAMATVSAFGERAPGTQKPLRKSSIWRSAERSHKWNGHLPAWM
jgi:hypothetical protein